MKDVFEKATELMFEHFKTCQTVHIFHRKNGGKWILICQSSGQHFVSDLELLRKENNNCGMYKISVAADMFVEII